MANAKKCDRCGAFYVPVANRQKIAVSVLDEARSWERLDLCDNCYEGLKEFLVFNNADKEEADGDSN